MMEIRKFYTAVIRDPFLALIVPFFVLSGFFFMTTPRSWYPEWFFPSLTGFGGIIYALLIILPDLVFNIDPNADLETLKRQQRARTRLQNYIAIACLFGYAGTLGLYELPLPYDKFIHFLNPFLAALAGSRFIYRWWNIPLDKALVITFGIMLGGSIVWELMEMGSDNIFGTKSFGLNGQAIGIDTFLDLSYDIAGTTFGLLAAKLRRSHWPEKAVEDA